MKALALAVALTALACRKPAPPPAAIHIPDAVAAARAAGKRILITVDGDDCPKCKAFAAVYERRPALAVLRDANFVALTSRGAVDKLPAPGELPYLYVLDVNGTLIDAEPATKLEKDGAYDLDKVEFFLKAFGPPKK